MPRKCWFNFYDSLLILWFLNQFLILIESSVNENDLMKHIHFLPNRTKFIRTDLNILKESKQGLIKPNKSHLSSKLPLMITISFKHQPFPNDSVNKYKMTFDLIFMILFWSYCFQTNFLWIHFDSIFNKWKWPTDTFPFPTISCQIHSNSFNLSRRTKPCFFHRAMSHSRE